MKKEKRMQYLSGFYIGRELLKKIDNYRKKSGLGKMAPTLRLLLQAGLQKLDRDNK